MDRSEVMDLVRSHLAGELDLDPAQIREESRFREDFDADSLDLYELVMELVGRYGSAVDEEQTLSPEARLVANVGKMDARKHLAAAVGSVMASNINQAMGTMLDTVVF